MKISFLVFVAFISLSLAILTKDISFVNQWPLFEALRTTSGIIFTVLGIWLAIMYPERLKMIEDDSYIESKSSQDFNELFNPIVVSIIILAIVLLLGIVAPLLKSYPYLIEYKFYFRKILFFILVFLTLVQIWVVFATLLPASRIKSFSDRTINRNQMTADRERNKNKKKK